MTNRWILYSELSLQFRETLFLEPLIGFDQFGNVLIGGDPNETLSFRAAKTQHKWYWRWLGYFLEWVDPGHLARSLEEEEDEGKDAVYYIRISKETPQ